MEGPSEMEVDGFGFPLGEILCDDLTWDQLQDYYSVERTFLDQCAPGTLWAKQKELFYRCHTTEIPAGSGFQKNKIANLNAKQQSISEGAGIDYKFESSTTQASGEFVLYPKRVARILGIMRARGSVQASTLKRRVDHFRSYSRFASTRHCPKAVEGPPFSKEYLEQLDQWYADMSKKLMHETKEKMAEKLEEGPPVHLYDLWKSASATWEDWCKKFKVHSCCNFTLQAQPPARVTQGSSYPQDNNRVFTPELALECQECVLRLCLSSMYQPPFRVGGLYNLMPVDPATGKPFEGEACSEKGCT